MTKAFFVKSSLLLIMLTGAAFSIVLYNQTLSLAGSFFDIRYAWISVPILFSISLFIAKVGGRSLSNDLESTKSFSEIRLFIILKFFIGGFIGCYIGFIVVGIIVLILYLILQTFFL